MVSVFLVGDNQITRAGLRRILEAQPAIRVLGEISSRRASADIVLRHSPNLVLIDLDPHAADILGTIETLLKAPGEAALLVVSDLNDHELARRALALGASGLVLKIQPPSVLIAMICELCPGCCDDLAPTRATTKDGHHRKDRILIKPAAGAKALLKINSLTAREREIVSLVGLGLKNKDIANRLSISDITVRHHLSSIFCKLEVADRQKLLILAHQYGLADLTLAVEPA
jgi:DNA-binding NarL/FixJ family response regulator